MIWYWCEHKYWPFLLSLAQQSCFFLYLESKQIGNVFCFLKSFNDRVFLPFLSLFFYWGVSSKMLISLLTIKKMQRNFTHCLWKYLGVRAESLEPDIFILVLCSFPAWPAGGESEKAAERQLQPQLRVPELSESCGCFSSAGGGGLVAALHFIRRCRQFGSCIVLPRYSCIFFPWEDNMNLLLSRIFLLYKYNCLSEVTEVYYK